MDPRESLAAVQQRADAATDGPWLSDIREDGRAWIDMPGIDDHALAVHGMSTDAEFIAAARTDVPRLVAALTAALDLADDPQRHKVALGHVDRDDLIAVITDALTPKENDS